LSASTPIPFVDLKRQYREHREDIDERMQRVLDHAQFILGPEVGELETRLATFCDARHCITVGSGTEALVIALMALGIGPRDEVITPPFTFIATAEAIVLVGATPIFVDVEEATCNIDVSQLGAALSVRTKAIIPVSLYGQPADMDDVNSLALPRGVAVIEDAAQSFGAVYRGRCSGHLSLIGATSFFPSKPLGCYGDGGALFTDDEALAKAMREIRTHGQERRYYHTRIGVGGRMDTLQCAIVLAKLDHFAHELEMRQEVARRYDALLAPHGDLVRRVAVKSDRTSAYAQYSVLVAQRDDVAQKLAADGIPTAVHYPIPIHRQPAYTRYASAEAFPISNRLAERMLNLPMHAYLEAGAQERIVESLVRAACACQLR
jgi:UDP-2-acetamido-2-deoxy-ribo-hexuluronate aminotransferase